MTRIALVAVAFGCGRSSSPPAPPIIAPSSVDARAIDAIAVHAQLIDATSIDATPRVAGKLHAAPRTAQLWPTRVCSDHGVLVVENDCGCNDGILCRVDRALVPTIALSLRKDPSRMPECTDCFPMVPGRCELPTLSLGRWTIQIAGAPAFEVSIGASGSVPDGACWVR